MKYLFFVCFAVVYSCAFAQSGIPVPYWVQLMHQPGADIGNIKEAYDAYYKEHTFVKDGNTQEFKRMMMAHTRDNNGSAFHQTVNEPKFHQKEYLQNTSSVVSSTSLPQWTCIGPFDFDKEAASHSYAPGAAHVYTVEQARSNPNVLYAGTANAGVWKTTDKGTNWSPLNPGMMMGTVRALEIDYTDANTVYFGGGDGKIYKTTDGGTTWNPTGNAAFQNVFIDVNDMIMSPVDNQKLWAATQQALYRTVDGGLNWDTLYTGIWQELEFKPGDPSVMYAIKQPLVQTEFYKSVDGGSTFTNNNVGYPVTVAPDEQKRTEIAVTPAAPHIVYAYATGVANGGSGLYGIYVSHDEGDNWTFQCCGTGPGGAPDSVTNKNICAWSEHGDDDGGQYYYDLALEVSPFDSNEVHANAVNHWISYDGGATFTCPTKWSQPDHLNYIHADIHDCHFYGNDWWWACDGGIFYSSSQWDTVTRKQNGIEGTDFWGFGVGEDDGDEVMVGGTYHNGTLLKDDHTYDHDWISCMGGDNILGSVNYGHSRIIFSDYGKHKLSGDRNVGLTQMSCAMLPSSSYWIGEAADQEYSPFEYDKVYIARDSSIWKSTDNGATYTLVHNFGAGKVTSIETSWQNPNVIYVAYYPGWWNNKKLYKTVDGGANWTDITPPNSLLGTDLWAPFDIAISTEDDNKLWLVRIPQSSTYANLDGKKVFLSTNGGMTWTNITTPTLDGEYITNVEYQRGCDGVYIGTRRAVYYRNSSMGDWALFNNNLPASTTSVQLLIDYKKRKIRNATNRSIWECDLYEAPHTECSISVDNAAVYCIRDTVYFHDHSAITDSNATWLWSFPGGNPSSSTLKNPKVLYPFTGTFSVSLTISDAYGSDSQTLNNFISVSNGCNADTIPGFALKVDGVSGYASAEPLNLNSNTVTISAWIKPNGVQNDWGGIVFTRSAVSTSGMSIKSDNEIRFHWNGDRWFIPTGLYVPDNQWSHIALVITPASATVYVNGVGFTDLNPCAPDELDANLNFGFDAYGGNRFFKGNIDEVAIYNRSLSQNEIRELAHLTRVPSDDLSLVAYYQFNEVYGIVTDRVGIRHASLVGGASRVTSTGPFGAGTSYRTDITSPGMTQFIATGFDIFFSPAATLPAGEVVVSRINQHPDHLPAAYVPSRSYWIMDNYGTNQTISNPDSIHFFGVGSVTTPQANNPAGFKLYKRGSNADGNTWGNIADSANFVSPGTDGNVFYRNPVSITACGQLILSDFGAPTGIHNPFQQESFADPVVIYPNPSERGGSIILRSALNEELKVIIFDDEGKEICSRTFFHQLEIPSSGFSAGMYFYSVRSATKIQNGKFIVE